MSLSPASSTPPLIALIDEAGDQGSRYGAGSSQFLVLGCLVAAATDVPQLLTVFDETKLERGHNRLIKKFSECSDKDNFVLTKKLATKPCRMIQVAVHKPSMDASFIRNNYTSEYNYLVKLALERVSWLVRDRWKAKGGLIDENRCKIIFSEHHGMSYQAMCEYLNILQDNPGKLNCSVEWNFLHPDVESAQHENERPIHLADTIASALHRAMEPKQHGMTDDRFQRNLLPLHYRRYGKVQGFKLFPAKQIAAMKAAGALGFTREIA